jgi:signal transduction histidine kinase
MTGKVTASGVTASGDCTDAVRPPDAWSGYTGWNVGFWLFIGLGLVRLISATDLTPGHRLIGLVVVCTLGLAYAVIPLRHSADLTRLNLTYLLIAIGCAGVACAVDPTLGMLLFIIYPHMWIFSGATRNGVILTGVLTLSSLIGFLTADGWSARGFWVIGPSVMISLLFSVLMGIWISRIIDQSRERAELIEQLEAARSRLGEAHHAQGVVAERERMAREIHDTLAQGFTSVIMLAQAARTQVDDDAPAAAALDSIEDVARENLSEARALVAAFSPVALDGSTLTDAVRRLTQRFGAETGVAIDVMVSGELAGLSRDREVVLLRATQEALANVRRHARARLVTVRLAEDGVSAIVQVDDDGVGFAPAGAVADGVSGSGASGSGASGSGASGSGASGSGGSGSGGPGSGGFGLAGMRGRVLDVGGEVEVVSAPDAGTRVTVRVPLVTAS